MHNPLKRIFTVISLALAALLLAVLLALGGLSLWLRTDAARQRVFQMGISLLREKLQTNVTASGISIELLKGQVWVYDMQVNDRDDSLLVRFDELHVGIAPHMLLDRQVVITDAELLGADARLWRDSLTSNFQFVLDAFKKKPDALRKKRSSSPLPKFELCVDVEDVNIQHLHARWDVRHKPRKNIGRPHRGAFDANHVDVLLDLKAKVRQQGRDSYRISLDDLQLRDKPSGLHVDQLQATATVGKKRVSIDRLQLRMDSSEVSMEPFTIDLARQRVVAPFALSAKVLLKDIALPFAPALSNFTTPLQLHTMVSGPLKCLSLQNIRINTPDNRLLLTARGSMDGLFAHKEELNLQFREIDLRASHNMKEQIVMHFAKKMRLKMLRQMRAVGDIHFRGSLDVLYKREIIAGKLDTRFGSIDTRFTIDGTTRYMTGYIKTHSFEMGKLMNIGQLGPVNCKIDFDINISKKTKRPPTALPNGRLPMGQIYATVYDAAYSMVTVPEVQLKLLSDGSTAQGYLWMPGEMEQMSARVSYVQTDQIQRVWFEFSRAAQQWLLKEAVAMLSDKLQADVAADSINVQLFDGDARVYGVRVMDQQHSPLISLDTLHVRLKTQELLQRKVHITHLGLYGLDANLNKDSVDANFNFVFKSFKKKTPSRRRRVVQQHKRSLQLVVNLEELLIDNMRVKWDVTDRQRKNVVNPKHGAFDVNHIDVLLNMQAGIRQTARGGYALDLRKMNLTDYANGLCFEDVRTQVVYERDQLHLDSLYVKLPQSWLRTEPVTLNLRSMSLVNPVRLHAHVVLQDIAEAFAPVLAHFTTPLDFQAVLSGDIHDVRVDDIMVHTHDGRMNVNGHGTLAGLVEGKEAMNLAFRDIIMDVDNETLMTLVMHFAKTVRLKMVRQLSKIGDVHFEGDVDLLHKRELFSGKLDTEYGTVKTAFSLDDNTHFMTGYLDAPELEIGKFLNLKALNPVNAHIDFNFNISSKVPRPATALPNGRLPQGHLQAIIRNAKFGFVRAKRIDAVLDSDGSTATGSIIVPKFLLDLIANFSYTQTDEIQHLRLRPRYKLHNYFRRRKEERMHHEHDK